jgi:hypothetical protein
MNTTSLPRSANADWYRVTDWRQETTCQWCGTPLLVGEMALEAFSGIYCSESCVKALHPDETTRG